jgi:hypothetical protein
VNFDDFFASLPPGPEDEVPRDQWGRPLIKPPEGVEPYYTSGKNAGYTPYHRASSFGKQIDDTFHLDLWIMRQVALGVAFDPELPGLIRSVGPTDPWDGSTIDLPTKKDRKQRLDALVERAKEASGSNIKSALGTAIHEATELIDLGYDLSGLDPHLRERAEAYWRFCREWGLRITSVEEFGVEDVNRVAGTWDRTGYAFETHSILDVKTSGSMDFAGIVFAVQLATYAHATKYDIATQTRSPHEEMDLETGWIIHVDRELGGPVELFKVDIGTGWKYAWLVDQVKEAQKTGKNAIVREADDEILKAIARATSLSELRGIFASNPTNAKHADLARLVAPRLGD